MNIHEEFCKMHGSDWIIQLNRLDGDGESICAKYQALYDAGEYAGPLLPMTHSTPEEWALRDAYNEIRRTTVMLWLQAIPRDQMLGMLNALAPLLCGVVEYLPGERMTVPLLQDAWNKAHPDEAPIIYDQDYPA